MLWLEMMDALHMYSACFPLLLSGIAFKIVAADADDDDDGDGDDGYCYFTAMNDDDVGEDAGL